MRSLFYPDERYRRITDIDPAALVARDIRGIVLDVDNTLTTHDNPHPADGVLEWLQAAQRVGLRLVILSNNHPKRVEPFAQMLGLEFEADGKKPLPGGFLRACAHLGIENSEAAAIGDQIFTDVIGARWAGVLCLMVDPIEPEAGWFFRLKRRLERPILKGYERRTRR